MESLTGIRVGDYRCGNVLHVGKRSVVYRAVAQNNTPVILKFLREELADAVSLARFRGEYAHMRAAADPNVLSALALLPFRNTLVMVVEDFGGVSLDDCLKLRGCTHEEISDLAAGIVTAIGAVHAAGLIHRDVSAANILWNTQTGQVKLADFGAASPYQESFTSNETTSRDLIGEHLEVTLPYMAPEQTGRMNRSVDYRSDYYAIGVVLYRLLVGQYPFQAADTLQWIHAHLALQPAFPHTLRHDVPQPLSQLAVKLLAKNPDERYQSNHGLLADLLHCREELRRTGAIAPFALGSKDYSSRLHIAKHLYGRNNALCMLTDALAIADADSLRAALICGYSGIGKSSLVAEVQHRQRSRGGYFLAGKHDQYLRNTPYAALVDALDAHVRCLLAETEQSVAGWRAAIIAALGENGCALLASMVPCVVQLIGPQPVPSNTSGPDAKNRLYQAIFKFLQVFGNADRPVVLSLDDLQWADTATLHLIERAFDEGPLHLLLIGAYRDNEVDARHPLALLLDRLRRKQAAIQLLDLGPLSDSDVAQLIADSLRQTPDEVAPLARLVTAKTGGNPFFINKFLMYLHTEQLLVFDTASLRWSWNLEAIAAAGITDNVVELLLKRLVQLPPPTQMALSIGAFVGNTFTLNQVADLCGEEAQELAVQLLPALRENLLSPLHRDGSVYGFQHDRIQEASAQLIAQDEAAPLHRRIGEMLLNTVTPEEREARIFEIAEHINRGLGDAPAPTSVLEAARVNLAAAQRGRATGAYDHALDFARKGLALLSDDAWEKAAELTFKLASEAQFNAFLNADFAEASQRFADILAHLDTPLDLVDCYRSMIFQLTMQGRYDEALGYGVEILYRLGMPISLDTLEQDTQTEFNLFETNLAAASYQELLLRPPISDPQSAKCAEVIATLAPTALFVNVPLLLLLVLKSANLLIRQGCAPGMGFMFVTMHLVYIALRNDYRSGHAAALFGMELARRMGARMDYGDATHVYGLCCAHWNRPLREGLPYEREAFEVLTEAGAVQMAGFTFFGAIAIRYEQGEPLADVMQEIVRGLAFVSKTRNGHAEASYLVYRQTIRALCGETVSPLSFDADDFDEAAYADSLGANAMAQCYYLIYKLELANFFAAADIAYELVGRIAGILHFITAFLPYGIFHFHAALACCSRLATLAEAERGDLLAAIAAHEALLAQWAEGAPSTFRHKCILVQAEKAAALGDQYLALAQYEAAIEAAAEVGALHEEALAAERAGLFFIESGLHLTGQYLLHRAVNAYALWGATAKVEALGRYLHASPKSLKLDTTTTLNSTGSAGLDVNTVVKCVEAVTLEIDYERLLQTLLRIALENAGAERGVLLLLGDGVLRVVAEADTGNGVRLLPDLPLDAGFAGAVSVVNYVRRSLDSVVLDDASQDERFSNDGYLLAQRSKSLLCLPIVKQGVLTGVLYLENNLATHVFNPSRVKILQIVASQAATAIENARLYSKLTFEIDERKEAELALRTERDFSSGLINEMPVIVCGLKPEGTMTFLNPAGEKITGYRSDEVLGKNGWALFYPEDEQDQVEQVRQALAQGDVRDYELTLTCKNGEKRTISWSSHTRLDEEGTPVELIGFGNDVTERKKTEELKIAKEAAEKATQTKSEFLANMSHEIRTPMNAIIGLSHLALKPEIPPDKLKDYVSKIHRAGTSLLGIINDILDFSKIEAGMLNMESAEFDLAEVLENVLTLVTPPAQEKGLLLSCQVPAEIPQRLVGDALRLGQVLLNLLNNAVKFTQQGTVELSVELLERTEQVKLCFTVSDTGIGMTLAQSERLFQAFSQADGSTTRKYGGTGLGLSIAKRLVELMHGQIWVESAAGQGSRFIFTVEFGQVHKTANESAQSLNADPKRYPHLDGARILLAEDNEINQLVAVELLKGVGAMVDIANNGREAIELLTASSRLYDAILMDLQMPEMDGFEATRIIRADERFQHIPILAMTAHVMEEERKRSLAAGMNDHITKPIEPDELFRALERWMGSALT